MAYATRVTRIANPRRKSYRRTKGHARKRTANTAPRRARRSHRRKMTDKQIRHFGTKAQRAALKRKRSRSSYRKGTVRKARVKRSNRATRHRTRRRRAPRSNPLLVEFGAINPHGGGTRRKSHKRRKSVARRTRRKSTRKTHARRRRVNAHRRVYRRRRHVSRRRNPVAVTRRRRVYRRRRHNAHRRSYHRRRHNPSAFGMGGGDMWKTVAGGLLGMAATKFLPTLLPPGITATLGSSQLMSVAITGAGAFVSGWLATKFMGPAWGKAVFVGGMIQTGSAALNAFAPAGIRSALALSGVGDITPTQGFVVPQNPVRQVVAMPSTAGMGAFRGAFGNRR